MSEMIERVAKAISGAPFTTGASRRKARAAIEAMREPTDAMMDALEDIPNEDFERPSKTWPLMIAAAPRLRG